MTAETVTVRGVKESIDTTEGAPVERQGTPEVSTVNRGVNWSAATLRVRLVEAVGRSRAYWVPPRVLVERPPSVAALTVYARRGAYAGRDGLLRRLGVAWLFAVALPWTVVCRYLEWVAQRPGRWVVAFGIWQLCARSAPGGWLVDNIVRPILAAVAWVVFP